MSVPPGHPSIVRDSDGQYSGRGRALTPEGGSAVLPHPRAAVMTVPPRSTRSPRRAVAPPDPHYLASDAAAPIGTALNLTRIPLGIAGRVRPGLQDRDMAEDESEREYLERMRRMPPVPTEQNDITVALTDAVGARCTITVSGDPKLGLPYGTDMLVLMAVYRLLEDDRARVARGGRSRLVDGALTGVTMRELLSAMGVPSDQQNGREIRRARMALRRLSGIRVEMLEDLLRDFNEVAEGIRTGVPGSAPVVPERAAFAATRRPTTRVEREARIAVLEVEFARVIRDGEEVSALVDRIRLNPRWYNELVSGWVAWIDDVRYRSLSKGLARRLYELCAYDVAVGAESPWRMGEEALLDLLALRGDTPKARTDHRRAISAAARDLIDADVLESAEWEKLGKSDYVLVLEPGPVFTLPRWLRGTGLLDDRETRVLYGFLRSFGTDPARARAMVTERPAAVRAAVRYALFLYETDPSRVKASWAAMIAERVANQRSNGGIVGYAEWEAQRFPSSAGGRAEEAGNGTEQAGALAAGAPRAPRPAPAIALPHNIPLGDQPDRGVLAVAGAPDAMDLCRAVQARVAGIEGVPPRLRGFVLQDTLLPWRIVPHAPGDAALVVVAQAIIFEVTRREISDLVAPLLHELSDRRVVRLAIEDYAPARHSTGGPVAQAGSQLVELGEPDGGSATGT